MQIGDKSIGQIIITGKNNELLAVVSDKEIIEKDDVSVTLDENLS